MLENEGLRLRSAQDMQPHGIAALVRRVVRRFALVPLSPDRAQTLADLKAYLATVEADYADLRRRNAHRLEIADL